MLHYSCHLNLLKFCSLFSVFSTFIHSRLWNQLKRLLWFLYHPLYTSNHKYCIYKASGWLILPPSWTLHLPATWQKIPQHLCYHHQVPQQRFPWSSPSKPSLVWGSRHTCKLHETPFTTKHTFLHVFFYLILCLGRDYRRHTIGCTGGRGPVVQRVALPPHSFRV